MLPYFEEPDWVHLSELYNAEKNNLLEICLEKKFNTEEKTAQKWESLRPKILKKRCHERLVYSTMHAKTPLCAFMEDVPDSASSARLSLYMDKGYQWVQRVRFRHARSHVHGVCDGVIATSLLAKLAKVHGLEDLDDRAPYLVAFIKPSLERNPGQHAMEMGATVHYFRDGDERLSKNWVLVIGKNSKMFLHSLGNTTQDMLAQLQRIRKVKKWAPLLDVEEDLPAKWLPNMKLSSAVWDHEKQEVARRVGDITLLWSCDDRHRQRAFAQGVTSWRDPAFTPELVGFTDPVKTATLKRIVDVNRGSEETPWLLVDPCLREKFPEILEATTTHLFVDFEYLANDFIYLVGVWEGEKYTAFWAEDLTQESLAEVWSAFRRYLEQFQGRYRCYFWYAEVRMMEKTGVAFTIENWTDLWGVARAGVAVRGAFDFGLKSFVRAFHEHGRMPFQYGDLECQDGLASIAMAESYYKTGDASLKENLEKYNRYDTEAMGHIWGAICEKL